MNFLSDLGIGFDGSDKKKRAAKKKKARDAARRAKYHVDYI